MASRAALITGGSSGIGLAIARALGLDDYSVTISARRPDKLEAAAQQLRDEGIEVHAVPANIAEEEDIKRLVESHRERFGRLDVLINNAGALIRRTPVADYTDDYVDAVLELNVKQVVRFIREGAAQMRRQGGGGSIVNVSSIAARHGGGPGSVIYAAAKGFVATATRGWAKELVCDRIRVNAVSPGVIMTPFHERYSTAEQLATMQATVPAGRLGLPEECVGAFLYLASEQMSGYVTGQMVEVNGGQYMP
jgi:3-oxoacyl-[acyl-carrier protein] reductase